jgi:thiamine kinase-like enzyme
LKNGEKYLAKVQYIKTAEGEEMLNEEFETAKKAGNEGIGPKMVKTFTCNAFRKGTQQHKSKDGKFHFMIMNKWGTNTLRAYIMEMKKSDNYKLFSGANYKRIITLLKEKLQHLFNLRIYHHDLHPGNILLDIKNDNVVDLAIVDYNPAYVWTFKKSEAEQVKKYYHETVEKYSSALDPNVVYVV